VCRSNTETCALHPEIAVVIPSLAGDVARLLAALERQTLRPVAVEVVRGVRPNGRARNQGVARTSAPLLVFVDDDALPGADDLLERLVAPLLADPSIGVCGAAKLLPPGAPPFQRWAAREVPRIVHPVVDELTETNPDPPSFYSEITTTCCAMRRTVFDEAGGFDEQLVRGVDTEFFVRVRRRGYCLAMAPRTWTYHPAPATLGALLRKHFMYGAGHAQEVRRDPARARGRTLHTPLHALAFFAFRTAILVPNIFLPYSYAAPSWRPGFKPLKALASYAGALGYLWGWYADRD
jgi:cellulose synthase/poly-beta-1,6-N-acetylglucosamine synthase-like glycosyltransferase